jgi:hypothetical protein
MNIPKLHSEAEAGSVIAQGVPGIAYPYDHDVPKDYILTVASRFGCNPRVPQAGSLALAC